MKDTGKEARAECLETCIICLGGVGQGMNTCLFPPYLVGVVSLAWSWMISLGRLVNEPQGYQHGDCADQGGYYCPYSVNDFISSHLGLGTQCMLEGFQNTVLVFHIIHYNLPNCVVIQN